MSKQLTLSSVIACMAMAALAFGYAPASSRIDAGDNVVPQQAELMPDLPTPSFFN